MGRRKIEGGRGIRREQDGGKEGGRKKGREGNTEGEQEKGPVSTSI